MLPTQVRPTSETVGDGADTPPDSAPARALREALDLAAKGYQLTPVTIERQPDGSKRARFRARWSSATYHDRRAGRELPGYSTDPEVIRDWSVQFGCSFGILCGPSGIEVVDLDSKHSDAGGGPAWWQTRTMPVSRHLVDTPAGVHLYWQRNGGPPLVNNAGQVAAGVDARSVGGIVFAPGSFVVGVDGEPEPRGYVARTPLPAPAELAHTPADVVELWRSVSGLGPVPDHQGPQVSGGDHPGAPAGSPGESSGAFGDAIESAGDRAFTAEQARAFIREQALALLDQATPGNRNDSLNRAGVVLGHFVGDFLSYEQALTLLRERGIGLGLDAEETEKTARSGLSAGMRDWTAVKVPDVLADATATVATTAPGTPEHEAAFRTAVDARKAAVRVREQADRELAAERRAADPAPGATLLGALLVEPDDDPDWLIGQLWPAQGKVLLSAPAKAGKTTFVGNVLRSLVDGDALLARPTVAGDWRVAASGFPVAALAERERGRRVGLLDFEMTRKKLRQWLRELRIGSGDGLAIETMRGRRWDPRDDDVRASWATYLRELDVGILVIDPIGPILQSLGIEENSTTEVGGVLTALDQLAYEAGGLELLVVHHAGHEGERARGTSAFLGWPDALWSLVRDQGTGARALRAEGRDVFLPETLLTYDKPTRRLTLGEGSRAAAKVAGDARVMAEIVAETPGQTGRQLRTLARDTDIGTKQQRAHDALEAARAAGLVHTHPGPNRAQHHFPNRSCEWCPAPESDPGSVAEPT
jgi:AAA domain/Bifunctional DNA primase/polymerase, N-terminal